KRPPRKIIVLGRPQLRLRVFPMILARLTNPPFKIQLPKPSCLPRLWRGTPNLDERVVKPGCSVPNSGWGMKTGPLWAMTPRSLCWSGKFVKGFVVFFFHFVSSCFSQPEPASPIIPWNPACKRTLISQPLVEKECRAAHLHLSLPPDFPTKSLTSDSLIR